MSVFGILAGRSWPRLKTIMFNLKAIQLQESRGKAWLASVELLRSATAYSCPSLEHVYISAGHSSVGYEPANEVLVGVEGVFSELEAILIGLADAGRFRTLAIAIWAERSDTSLHDAQHDSSLQTLLPRLHERGMLVFRDFTEDYTDDILEGAL